MVWAYGTMGKQHAYNLRHLIPEAQLIAVADADVKRASRSPPNSKSTTAYNSVEALAERKDIQAIVVVTPAKFHGAAMRVCAQAGKDIFCEKPFTLTVEEADEMLDLTQKAGVRVQVGHVRRYDPPNVRAKQRIEAGEIGDPVIFKSLARDPAPPPVSYMASGVNGMFFQDSTVHEFDLGRWLMNDEISEIHAYGAVLVFPEIAQFNDIDTALLNMKFSRGTLGAVENYMQSGYGYDIRTEIVGSKGTIIMGYLQQTAEAGADGGRRQDRHRRPLSGSLRRRIPQPNARFRSDHPCRSRTESGRIRWSPGRRSCGCGGALLSRRACRDGAESNATRSR